MRARRTRMLAAVLGTAVLVAGAAPAAVLAGSRAADSSAVQTAALGTEFAVQYARFYPRKDDYRDTNLISGTTLVPATVTIRIYNSGGTRIKSFLLGAQEGAYSVVWNGRKKDSSLFPQGTYTVKQFVTAGPPPRPRPTRSSCPTRSSTWYLGSQTRYADTGAFFTAGDGTVASADDATACHQSHRRLCRRRLCHGPVHVHPAQRPRLRVAPGLDLRHGQHRR